MSFIKIQKIDPTRITNPPPGHVYIGQDLTNSGFTGFWQKDEWGNIYYINGSGATYITYNITGTTYIITGSTSSGTSGNNGTSGTSGIGTSGTSGKTGVSGTSGTASTSGTSGIGTAGTSGTSGKSGTGGTSGKTGSSGTSGIGTSGSSGSSGSSGLDGAYGGATRKWMLNLSNSTPVAGEMYISAISDQLSLLYYLRLNRVDADNDLLEGWISTWDYGLLKIEDRFNYSVLGIYLIHSGSTVVKITSDIYEISGLTILSADGVVSDGDYLVSYIAYGHDGIFFGTSGSSGTSGENGTSGSSGIGSSGTSGISGSSGTSSDGSSGTSGVNLSFTEYDLGDVSGNISIDWSNGVYQTCRLTGSIIITSFSNPSNGGLYNIRVKQGTLGGYTISWPTGTNGVHWHNSASPVQTSTADVIDMYLLIYDNDLRWYLGVKTMSNLT